MAMIASLLSATTSSGPSAPQPAAGRISQLLPTVKCSTCGQPVPMDELGEHTCSPPPPLPTAPETPKSNNASLLPARLQGRVGSPGPSSNAGPSQGGPGAGGGGHKSNLSTAERLRIKTTGSSSGGTSPTQPSFMPRSSPLARRDPETASTKSDEHEVPFPSNANSNPNPNAGPGPAPRMRTPSNASGPSNIPPAAAIARMRTPSNASSRSYNNPAVPPPRMRTPSNANAGVPMSLPGGPRTRTPSNAGPGPMPTMPPPNLPNGLPSGPGRPMPPPQQRSASISTMNSVNAPGGRGPIGAPIPAPGGPARSFTGPPPSGPPGVGPGGYFNNNANLNAGNGSGGPRPMGNGPQPPSNGNPNANVNANPNGRPPPGPLDFIPPPERGIDTKSGGEAGMAGVGRRGFAAAARAAMFAAPGPGRPPMGPGGGGGPPYMGQGGAPPPPGPPGQYAMRRPNAPQYLDINSDARSASTPPLSPGSGYSSHSPSLPSPLSQTDFSSNFPVQQSKNGVVLPMQPQTRTPSPFMVDRAATPRSNSAKPPSPVDSPLTARPNMDNASHYRKDSTATMSSARSASRPRGVDRRAPSPIESESEYGGLAYADSTDYEDDNDERRRDLDDDDDDNFNTRVGRRRSRSPPSTAKPSAAQALMERTHSKAGSVASSRSAIQFGSVRSRSRSKDRVGLQRMGGGAASIRSGSSLSREGSVSSRYSDENEDRLDDLAARLARSQSSASKMSAVSSSSSNHLRPRGIGLPKSPSKPAASTPTPSASQHRPGAPSVSGSIRSRLNISIDETKERAAANAGKDMTADDNESLFGSANGAKTYRSNTVQGLQSPDAAKKPVKLPVRSLTSPKVEGFRPLVGESSSLAGGSSSKKARQPRTCMKCKKAIENGRWVSVDNGGVLCEKCWKNMYLPKCRRCELPIEKAAVSSSDGQLKGKYHKECFNCHTCHKPFPDKTFYVYDGKPFCAYHYHEANDSLCSAARCGQPIEGPCAVSHTGDRYHPEHMTCEYPGYPECRERLNEYWEVDGRMLCERHAHNATSSDSEDESRDRGMQSSKAMKRVTRFIDLAGAGGMGAGAAPSNGNRL